MGYNERSLLAKAAEPENRHRIAAWVVYGAEVNARGPILGVVRGTLLDAIDWARTKPEAQGWGGLDSDIHEIVLVDAVRTGRDQ